MTAPLLIIAALPPHLGVLQHKTASGRIEKDTFNSDEHFVDVPPAEVSTLSREVRLELGQGHNS
jgi:hypothetical protein